MTSLPYVVTPELLAELEEKGARYLPTLELMQKEQTSMLASFQHGNVPRRRWERLVACEGRGCPNRTCSSACWFGERAAYLSLVAQAHDLLEQTGLPLWFVTVIDPRYRVSAGELRAMALDGMKQGLSRRFKHIEAAYGPLHAFGGIEASFEIGRNGEPYWGPHTHLVVAARCPEAELKAALRPAGDLPRGFRPIMMTPVYNLGNALSYCGKRTPAQRVSTTGSRTTRDCLKQPVQSRANLEYNIWLLGLRPTERLVMRGFRRVHGRLTLLR
ncbi:hypothetical protein [Methylobacterium sp. WL19]|uniref:hypothetical protein n=1 Tax=Methylobacterium sp. WL19 TaxID=2603896 RepID=UPI0011CB0CFA|nr:hypothetical protein [Methylobacterium sp. WL19]TXN29131.1 hypothetical protein FV220_07610 [Methylobacterium sp. WL19]